MEYPDLSPITLPGLTAAAPPSPAPSRARSSARAVPVPVSGPSLIPAPAWREHVNKHRDTPALFASLPDGTPLRLTPAGVQFYEEITGRMLWPVNAREASVLLWAAALTPAAQEALWLPQEPLSREIESESDSDSGAAPAPLIPGLSGQELTRYFLRWQSAVIPPSLAALMDVQTIAAALWNHENATAVEIDTDALPELPDDPSAAGSADDPEKKNPAPPLTGSPSSATPSAEATSPAGPPSCFTPATAPSSPPTAPGSPPPDSPSSPPPTAPAANPIPPPASCP